MSGEDNTAKIYQDGPDFLLEKNTGNVIIKDDGVYPTTRTGNTLDPVPFDSAVQAKLNNAIYAMSQKVSLDTAKGIVDLLAEKMEDFDGPETSS